MLQLPHVWVLPPTPLPTSPGKMCHYLCITQVSLSPPGLPCLGGHTAKRRAQTPQWSWWKGEVRGQQARAAREKPLLGVFWGGYVCASLHVDSYVFGCKNGKQKRVSSNGEMKILCELVTMVLWERS